MTSCDQDHLGNLLWAKVQWYDLGQELATALAGRRFDSSMAIKIDPSESICELARAFPGTTFRSIAERAQTLAITVASPERAYCRPDPR